MTDWNENVRVAESGADVSYLAQQDRTDAQRHADTAWDAAEADLDTMAEALASNIRWVQSLGVPVPRKVLDIKPILSEYRATLADERASRG